MLAFVTDSMKVIFGSMKLAGTFNGLYDHPRDSRVSKSLIWSACDAGFNIVDTAPLYARGRAEKMLGRFLPVNTTIWTKVGVNIHAPLPLLDYTLEGMKSSVVESLERLNRCSLGAVFIHNPSPAILKKDDIYNFQKWAKGVGVAERVGISLSRPRDFSYVKDTTCFDMVMCDPFGTQVDLSYIRRIAKNGQLVFRSIFQGGALFQGCLDRRLLIKCNVDSFESAFSPMAVVIAPRTLSQLKDYADFFNKVAKSNLE